MHQRFGAVRLCQNRVVAAQTTEEQGTADTKDWQLAAVQAEVRNEMQGREKKMRLLRLRFWTHSGTNLFKTIKQTVKMKQHSGCRTVGEAHMGGIIYFVKVLCKCISFVFNSYVSI